MNFAPGKSARRCGIRALCAGFFRSNLRSGERAASFATKYRKDSLHFLNSSEEAPWKRTSFANTLESRSGKYKQLKKESAPIVAVAISSSWGKCAASGTSSMGRVGGSRRKISQREIGSTGLG